MASAVDPPNDNPGAGTPGDSGYVPGTGPNTKIAVVVSSSNFTFTADMIVAAGGPWPAFTIKVTPINDYGVGTIAEFDYPPP